MALDRLSELIRTVITREHLDELPETRVKGPRPSLFKLLTAREELPEDPPGPAGKGGGLSWILRPETLPTDPSPPPSGQPSFLGTLLSRERLTEEQAPARDAGGTRGGRA